jgi:hypothetical protein
MGGQWRVPELISDSGSRGIMIVVCFERLMNLDCAILGEGML